MPEFNGDKLRPMKVNDLSMVLEWRNHEAVRKNMYTDHVISEDEHFSWFQRTSSDNSIKHFIFESHGKPLGFVSFSQIDEANKRAHWAFYSGDLSTKGLGSRMEFLALTYAFDELGLNKLCCEVLGFNQSVVKFHQKFGFEIEGCLKQHHIKDGEAHDIILLAFYKDKWPHVKKTQLEKVKNV